MTNVKKPPGKKLFGFPGSHDSVETELLRWVRGLILSDDQLVDALGHLRSSYKVLKTEKFVPDAAKIRWQVEVALRDAERSRSALALKPSQGPGTT
jgi:hypothetical protein